MRSFLSGLVILFWAGAASAAPVQWQLDDVVLTDGASVTGGFSFDAATGTYSDIALSRSIGSVQEAAQFSAISPAVTPNAGLVIFVTDAADLTGQLFLQLLFSTNLTDPGQTTPLNIAGSGTGRCATFDCGQVVATGAQFATGGAVSPVAPVPVPATGLLLAMGLAAVMGLRRKPA